MKVFGEGEPSVVIDGTPRALPAVIARMGMRIIGMDQALLNELISTSAGGAAGGAVAGVVILAVQWAASAILLWRHQRSVYSWLEKHSDKDNEPFRSTKAIASYNNLTEDRVRYVCSYDVRIKLSTGDKEDLWSIHIRNRTASLLTGIQEEK